MKANLRIITMFIIVLAFISAGCSIPLFVAPADVSNGAESTAAAQTVAAQLTEIALSWTETPVPTGSEERKPEMASKWKE